MSDMPERRNDGLTKLDDEFFPSPLLVRIWIRSDSTSVFLVVSLHEGYVRMDVTKRPSSVCTDPN